MQDPTRPAWYKPMRGSGLGIPHFDDMPYFFAMPPAGLFQKLFTFRFATFTFTFLPCHLQVWFFLQVYHSHFYFPQNFFAMPPAGSVLKIFSFRFATFTFTLVFHDLFLLLSLLLYHTSSEKSEPCDDFLSPKLTLHLKLNLYILQEISGNGPRPR